MKTKAASDFDFIVIGGGSAGIPLAHDLAAAGNRVALIEQSHLGGSCVNFGCTPTKTAIASAKLAADARRAMDFGLKIPRVDVLFDEVIKQARQIVQDDRTSLEEGFRGRPNLTLIWARAELCGKNEDGRFRVKVGEEILSARQVVLDTGSRSVIPTIDGLNPEEILTSENWLELSELPRKVAFLGSGYIGLEMGQFYRRMGSEVVLLEQGPQIISREDPDIANALMGYLEKEGIRFQLNTRLLKVEGERGSYRLTTSGGVIEATHLFVATGRQGNTGNLGLESLRLRPEARGYIECDSRLATRVEGLWVAGDLRGGPLFTHTAWDDYRILKSQLLGDGKRTTDRIVPYAVFTDPELGRVGLTEREARQRHPTVGIFQFSENAKAIEERAARGFIKLVVDPASKRILGAAVLGPAGSELVHIYGTAMAAQAPYTVIEDEIMIHPTLAEAIQSATAEISSAKREEKKAAA